MFNSLKIAAFCLFSSISLFSNAFEDSEMIGEYQVGAPESGLDMHFWLTVDHKMIGKGQGNPCIGTWTYENDQITVTPTCAMFDGQDRLFMHINAVLTLDLEGFTREQLLSEDGFETTIEGNVTTYGRGDTNKLNKLKVQVKKYS